VLGEGRERNRCWWQKGICSLFQQLPLRGDWSTWDTSNTHFLLVFGTNVCKLVAYPFLLCLVDLEVPLGFSEGCDLPTFMG
jgi:hypothetical protein